MRIGSFELRFAPIPWLAALLLFAFLAKLGFWQLNRAEEKRQILAAQTEASTKAPLSLDELNGDWRDWPYRRIVVEGKLDLSRQFLLDNQVVDKQVGFNVITPLKTGDSKQGLLIDRGFVPIAETRERLPEIEGNCETRRFTATIYVPTSGYRLGDMDGAAATDWPRIIQFFDFEQIEERLDTRVAPVVLRLAPDAPCGFKREWKWVSSQPVRHTGYAIQWFAMAATVMVLFLVLSFKRR